MGRSRIVVLNGGPSSGKTTMASAFRDRRAAAGECWLVIGIDDYLARLPAPWRGAGGQGGPFAADGVRFEGTGDEARVHLGHVGRALVRAYQAAVAGAGRAGLDVLVDEVVIDRTSWQDWGRALAGLEVVWVGVRCAPDVAEDRNRSRGLDRYPGLAGSMALGAHRHARYDVEIDTTTLSAAEAVDELDRVLGPGGS